MTRRSSVLAFLSALAVVLYLDRVCISLAMPRIQEELDIAPERFGWVSLAFSSAYALFEMPSGRAGDRLGPRRVFTRIVVCWSVFTALTGLVTSFGQLLVVRFLFGAGEAGSWPNASAVVARWFPEARARAMGVFGAATQVGGGLSPLIVIPLQLRFGWRASFFLFAILGLVWAAGWWRLYREPPPLQGQPEEPVALLADVARSRTVQALAVQFAGLVFSIYFGIFWLPVFLVRARGFTEGELRWVALAWVGGLLGNGVGGLLCDAVARRYGACTGRRRVGGAGAAVGAAGFALAALATSKGLTLTSLTLAFIALNVANVTSFAVCIDVGGRAAGTVSGLMNTAGQVGGSASGLVFGYLVKFTGSYDVPVVVMAIVTATSAAAWWFIDAGTQLEVERGTRLQHV